MATGTDQYLIRFDGGGCFSLDLNRIGIREFSASAVSFDPLLFEQHVNPAGQRINNL